MAKYKRLSPSGSRNMRAKSSARLHLECLEKRTLLSAGGLSIAPAAAVAWPAALAGEFSQIGEHQFTQATVQVAHETAQVTQDGGQILHRAPMAVQVAAETPIVSPLLSVDQVPFGLGKLSYEQPAAGDQSGIPIRLADYPRNDDPVIATSLSTDAFFSVSNQPFAADSVALLQDQPAISHGVMATNLAPAQVDPSKTAAGIVPDFDVANLEVHGNDPLPSYYFVVSGSFSNRMAPQPRFSGGWQLMPDFLAPAIDPTAGLPPAIDAFSVSRGPAGFRGPPGQTVDVEIGNDVSPALPPSAQPAKGRGPEMSTMSDASRTGNQALAAEGTSSPASSRTANLLAANVVMVDATAANSLGGEFISFDDAAVATPQLGSLPALNPGFKGVENTDLDQGNWLSDILPSPRGAAGSGSPGSDSVRSARNLAAEVSFEPAPVIYQPIADADEGGSIELAIAAPSPGAPGDVPPAGESAADGAARQLSEPRSESGVWLFCDVEVAVAPALPTDDSPLAAVPRQSAGSGVVATGVPSWKADAMTELVPRLPESPQRTLARFAEHLPLLLGMTVLVSRGGLRLEEKVSERERRLRSLEDLRRMPRD